MKAKNVPANIDRIMYAVVSDDGTAATFVPDQWSPVALAESAFTADQLKLLQSTEPDERKLHAVKVRVRIDLIPRGSSRRTA